MNRLWNYCAFCGKRIETGEKCWGLPNGESVCTDCCVAENEGAAVSEWRGRTGGLTMATKRVCDRCGAEINPYNSVTYAGMRRVKNDINDNDYELCVSCAHKLRKWFNGEENDNG